MSHSGSLKLFPVKLQLTFPTLFLVSKVRVVQDEQVFGGLYLLNLFLFVYYETYLPSLKILSCGNSVPSAVPLLNRRGNPHGLAESERVLVCPASAAGMLCGSSLHVDPDGRHGSVEGIKKAEPSMLVSCAARSAWY